MRKYTFWQWFFDILGVIGSLIAVSLVFYRASPPMRLAFIVFIVVGIGACAAFYVNAKRNL